MDKPEGFESVSDATATALAESVHNLADFIMTHQGEIGSTLNLLHDKCHETYSPESEEYVAIHDFINRFAETVEKVQTASFSVMMEQMLGGPLPAE